MLSRDEVGTGRVDSVRRLARAYRNLLPRPHLRKSKENKSISNLAPFATMTTTIAVADQLLSPKATVNKLETSCQKCTNGNKVVVTFPDREFTFHSQWLRDARCDDGASRDSVTAICQQSTEKVRIVDAKMGKEGPRPTMNVTWTDGVVSKFPIEWLRVMGPIVASSTKDTKLTEKPSLDKGWTVEKLTIPEISYKELFATDAERKRADKLTLSLLDHLLHPSSPGIIKVIDMPDPNVEDELNHVNNLNTQILKKVFGSVFVHPTRGADKSFNVSSRSKEAEKRKELPNYDTTKVLLPHADHAFYETPIQVQGWYILEGESENTFVSVLAVLETLKQESPESYHALCTTPMALGRVSAFYGEPVYQMTVDTAVTMQPGSDGDFKRVRWHPNFIGSLLCPYEEYDSARLAQQRFRDIMRRPTHQLTLRLEPGDMFIWNNFKILHGREKVFTSPRTGVGQTVPEQVVHDRYRALCIGMLGGLVDEQWLVHLPMPQLREMVKLVQDECYSAAVEL